MQITSLPFWLMIVSMATAVLAIADDQLTLTAADWHHRVNSFQAGLKWLLHRLPVNHAWGDALNWIEMFGDDWTSIVDRIAEHVDYTPDHRLSHRHLHDASGALYEIAFADSLELSKQYRADFVFFEIQCETTHVVRKLEQLAGHHLFKAVQLGNAVADLNDRSDFSDRY